VVLNCRHRSLDHRNVDTEEIGEPGGGIGHASALVSGSNAMIDTLRLAQAPSKTAIRIREEGVFMTRRLFVTLSAVSSLVATPAMAGSLFAPFTFVPGSNAPYCIITNADSKPIEVSVSATGFAGNVLTPTSNNCPDAPDTLNPSATCYAVYADSSDLACRFTTKGKARAHTEVLDGSNNVVTTIPATAK
jgi:hypothetical protein